MIKGQRRIGRRGAGSTCQDSKDTAEEFANAQKPSTTAKKELSANRKTLEDTRNPFGQPQGMAGGRSSVVAQLDPNYTGSVPGGGWISEKQAQNEQAKEQYEQSNLF